jgi:hypothetical protein
MRGVIQQHDNVVGLEAKGANQELLHIPRVIYAASQLSIRPCVINSDAKRFLASCTLRPLKLLLLLR